ncbi:histidine kinase [Streptomyces iconiensis]|uniref:Histidine kinase n=2 Tax=Streptomyces iconiensis TaxID=1384038 RepID=A0ABT6ZWH1_9ACTN|nr:histidine kinase [Streptomyces iconiensis]MDJ1133417.1 histidine kinase [Streptomyces iconiensis]
MGIGAISHLIQGRTGNPWIGGAALLAFNSLYIGVVFASFDPRRRDSRVPLYELAALTAVTYAVAIGYGDAWTMFFPLLSLASGTVRKLKGKALVAWLVVLSVSAGLVTGMRGDGLDPWSLAYGTFISGMVTATVLSLFDTVRKLDATRQELARTAVERERLRFSRDLHDLLGHTLSVIVVKAEAVRRLAERDQREAALAQAADIEAVGRQALTEIREAVTGYREGSLSTELDRACSVLEAAGILPVVRQSGPPLPPQAEALLGWVVRESVTNTVRHSGAARCDIEVRGAEDRVRLTVTDDGHGPGTAPAVGSDTGSDTGSVAGPDTRPDAGLDTRPDGSGPDGSGPESMRGRARAGTGLKGLAERLSAAGGALDHGPDGRRGFRVVAELPVDTGDSMRTDQERADQERAER